MTGRDGLEHGGVAADGRLAIPELPLAHLAPLREGGEAGGVPALALQGGVVLVEGHALIGDVGAEVLFDDAHHGSHPDLKRPLRLLDEAHELALAPAAG